MAGNGDFKITYSTLDSPAEEVHEAFEAAVRTVRDDLGATRPMWIDGEARAGAEQFDDRSPADRDLLIGRFPQATRQDAADAVAGADRAFDGWRKTPWRERVEMLLGAADELSDRRFELAALMTLEVGKTRFESLADVEEAADLIRYYCQQFEDADGFDRPMGRLAPNERTRDLLRPYGAWVVISPFNFPVALAAGMTAGALVGGNTVVFKPANEAAASGLALYEVLAAHLPRGVVNFVTGDGGPVGEEAASNHRAQGLVFTGSRAVGHHLFRTLNASSPKPCFLELGGKNAAIVTAEADLEKAVEGVARSAFGFGGQKCSACSRVYVASEVAARFRSMLVERAAAVEIGDPVDRETFLGPVISETARDRFAAAVDQARREGEIVCGGGVLTGPPFDRGYFVTPTVVDRLPDDHQLMLDELFLPFLCLREVDSLDQAIELANASEYGLTAGVFSESRSELDEFFDRIEAGIAYANRASGATTGAWPGVNPFCGWKASGSTGKGVCGPYYVAQFLREQSQTIMD